MMPFFNWTEIVKDMEPGSTLPAGMSRRGIILGEVMLALHEAVPESESHLHRHPSAQITYMLEGKLRMTVDGKEQVLSPGSLRLYPPEHFAWDRIPRSTCVGPGYLFAAAGGHH